MNDLHKAYAVLGLEPGSSMDSIMRRYKRLIMVWHPDRAPTKEHKDFAEEELKKINNAKDLLTKHFHGGHKATGCECQPGQATGAGAKSTAGASAGPGPRYHQSKTAEEKQREDEAARNRDAARKRREQEEAKQKQDKANQEYQKKQAEQSMQSAMQQQGALKDEKLRWQISIGIIIAFIGLEIFGSAAIGMKDWWHDFTWKWQRDHPSSDAGSKPPDIGINTGTDTGTTTSAPYIPPYDRTPGGNTTTWQQEQEQRDKEQKDREKKQKDQDIYFAKLEVDKYEKAIEHSQTTIAQLEAQIANPEISGVERNKLVDYQNFQRKCLADSQEGLKYAQQKLSQLQGGSEPSTPSIVSPLPGSGPGIPLVPIPERKSFFSSTPSIYKSPFGPAQNPDTVPATSKPMFDFSKQGGALDPNSVPDSSQSSLEYFSKLKTVPLTPSTSQPPAQTNTGDGSSLQSLLDSFKTRRSTQSLQDILKNTGTSTTTSP